jgi:hypothetical protein
LPIFTFFHLICLSMQKLSQWSERFTMAETMMTTRTPTKKCDQPPPRTGWSSQEPEAEASHGSTTHRPRTLSHVRGATQQQQVPSPAPSLAGEKETEATSNADSPLCVKKKMSRRAAREPRIRPTRPTAAAAAGSSTASNKSNHLRKASTSSALTNNSSKNSNTWVIKSAAIPSSTTSVCESPAGKNLKSCYQSVPSKSISSQPTNGSVPNKSVLDPTLIVKVADDKVSGGDARHAGELTDSNAFRGYEIKDFGKIATGDQFKTQSADTTKMYSANAAPTRTKGNVDKGARKFANQKLDAAVSTSNHAKDKKNLKFSKKIKRATAIRKNATAREKDKTKSTSTNVTFVKTFDAKSTIAKTSRKFRSTGHDSTESNVIHTPIAETLTAMLDDPGLLRSSGEVWDQYLQDTADDIAGYVLNKNHDFDPIPYDSLASGAVVDVDGNSIMDFLDIQDLLSPSRLVNEIDFQNTLETTEPTVGGSSNDEPPICQNERSNEDVTAGSKRKHDESQGQETEGDDESGVVVGPDSSQMQVIYRMLMYLKESNDSKHSQLASVFQAIVAHCERLHAENHPKFMHLPGAILDEMIEHIGGQTFREIFLAAKTCDHLRLHRARPVNQNPTIVQVAIAYGFQLAKTKRASVEGSDVRAKMIDESVQAFLTMNEESRVIFWETFLTGRS